METALKELKTKLAEIYDLGGIRGVLNWDQSTYMPAGGARARGRQMAVLGRIMQEKASDPEIGKLLDKLDGFGESLPYDHDDAALIRVARRDYERIIKVPPKYMEKVAAHSSESYQAWAKARPENNFKGVEPYLERTLEYSREYANFFPGYDHIADPLIDRSDYGMKADSVQALFAELRQALVPLVEAITSQPQVDDSCVHEFYPEAAQAQFGEMVVRDFGYDFSRGRLDKTHHPFATKFSLGDVRITTRYKERDLTEGLFGTMHESGHAMYEQGAKIEYEGTPLARGTSSGVHESQSRLWENRVGRSLAFWKHYYAKLQQTFPDQLGKVDLETFYKAVNKVSRGLIRTDADEVTYNLHVMIRFDLELALLEGRLAVKDLPEAWDARYASDLGVSAPDYCDGVLQDVHWYAGSIGGAFQGYTLGNILGAQFYAKAYEAHPEIEDEMAQGKFATLYGWLRENIYQHGRKFTADELVERITGGRVQIAPYIAYLNRKYSEIYQL